MKNVRQSIYLRVYELIFVRRQRQGREERGIHCWKPQTGPSAEFTFATPRFSERKQLQLISQLSPLYGPTYQPNSVWGLFSRTLYKTLRG